MTCILSHSKNVLQVLVIGHFDFLFDSMFAIQECSSALGVIRALKFGIQPVSLPNFSLNRLSYPDQVFFSVQQIWKV